MGKLAIQPVRKMAHADWLPSHAISFSRKPASFGRKIFELIWRQTKQNETRFTKDLLQQTIRKRIKHFQH